MLLLFLLLHWPLDYRLLSVEDARDDPAPLVEALEGPHVRQAIRALGRFERPELGPSIAPFLRSTDPDLRIEAANALAQMKARVELAPVLAGERDPRVRAWVYEAMGRLGEGGEASLLPGLREEETVRLGAVKGLERFYRVNGKEPSTQAVAALRRTVRDSRASPVRQLALLALNRANDRDLETLESAVRDPDPLVRRLAVSGLQEWRDDPSFMVRYEGLRASKDCSRAEASLADPSEHVALLAIDLLGNGCSAGPLEAMVDSDRGWRRKTRALVSLARVDAGSAKARLPRFVSDEVWQVRVSAARAAKILGDEAALARLRSDDDPNVRAEALVTPEQALAALSSDHYGLLMTALEKLEGWNRPEAVPALLSALDRLNGERRHTSRDPRRLLLERLRAIDAPGIAGRLEPLVEDFDPFIAALASEVIEAKTGRKLEPKTKRFAPDPLPPEERLLALQGARATIQMKEAGSFVIQLLPEHAPMTVSKFVELAERGYYDGLTFHRIVPNFVIQGGSPGANEYVGTAGYLRDEVSLLSHERGTLGISTRGRDTGDSQFFVNLVDNYRLDHEYTVFARVIEGMELVDRIQEGDVMLSVRVVRSR